MQSAGARDMDYISFTFEELDQEDRPCKCCRFNQGKDLPIPSDLSVNEIERATKKFSLDIFKDWTKLNAILKRYEVTIQKRWMKKSVKARRDILLLAWPGMSATHRPDFVNLRAIKKQAPRSRTCMAEAYLWPYINLEDLQQRNLLLMFLKSRGRNLPETFRLADVKAAHLGDGWEKGLDFADTLNEYCCPTHYVKDCDESDVCMLFEERHSPSRYGRIITNHARSLSPKQYKHLRRSHEGLLSLEIHQSTYRFLVKCTKLILHDITPAMLFLAPTLPEPAMTGIPGPCQYPSLSAHSREAPYHVPQMLDLQRLRMLVHSRRQSAEDHVWLLKEDPLYFIANLREYTEHTGDRALDTIDWYRILGMMLTNVYETYVFWDDVHRRLTNMASIEVQLARANEKSVWLSRQDEEKWAAMLEVLWRLMMVPICLLWEGIPSSPRLRNKYRWEIIQDPDSPAKGRWLIKAKASDAERRLDTLFYAINNEHQRELHGLHGLVQEVQYMLETDSEAAHLMDPWIATQFADVALVSEIINAVDALSPWFSESKAAKMNHRHGVAKRVDKTRNLINKIKEGVMRVTLDSQALHFNPLDRDMIDYPAEKRITKANSDQMVRAEISLDLFWFSLENAVNEAVGISLARVLECRAKDRTIFRTQPWIWDDLERSRSISSSSGSSIIQDEHSHGVLSELNSNIQRTNYPDMPFPKKELVKTPARTKIKTHGKPAAADPRIIIPVNDVRRETAQAEPVEKVAIPKRAFKVFSALLPSPAAAQQQRPEIPWDDLLFAMNAIGLQPIKLYGSVWMFRPVAKGEIVETDSGIRTVGKLSLERSIQFHEPKEVRKGAKIPKAMVRTFGRRLKHAFGWGVAEDIFSCE